METRFETSLPKSVLISMTGLLLLGQLQAQTFTVLHNFKDNGLRPYAGLTQSGNFLYGTTSYGGTVFALHPDGTGFTNLHVFTGGTDGASPYAELVISGSTLYGTASAGGNVAGTLFKLNTNGSGFVTVHNFTAGGYNSSSIYTNRDGLRPYAGLIVSGDTLYGTAVEGGTSGFGTVFKVRTNGASFTTLHNFSAVGGPSTNSDGGWPYGKLVLSSNSLFGTSKIGGSAGNGTVFTLHTDGTGFTNLHDFTGGSDGSGPDAGLILSGDTLYGIAYRGGALGVGVVFGIHTDGSGFTNIHSFNGIDGANPSGALVLSGKTLYGSTEHGGDLFGGTLFAIHTNGSGFTTLYSFRSADFGTNSGGANPSAGLIFSGNTLFGTASDGGSSGYGTAFALSLPFPAPIPLNIQRSSGAIILSWTNAAFGLQAASTVTNNFTNLSSATSPYTNTLTGPHQFFRLIAP